MQIVRAGLLIDGSGAPPRKDIDVYIEGGWIVALVERCASTPPAGAGLIDAGEYTVMPGLIDCHTHVLWNGAPDEPLNGREGLVSELTGMAAYKAYANARRDLEAGFTTLRDMLSYDFIDVSLRNAIQQGLLVGPRLLACGYGLTATGGHMDLRSGLRPDVQLGYFNNIVDTPDEARKAVRQLVRMGVDHIKINAGRGYRRKGRPILLAPEMNEAVLNTIVEEAHTAGRKVAAHSLGSAGEYWAVLAGVDSLEHAHFIDERTMQAMAERGTFLVPTMTHCVRNAREIRARLPEQAWAEDFILYAYDSMYRVLPRALQLGVRFAAGTDAGADLVPHGCNAQELELLTTLGMSPMQAIQAATGAAAELLAVEHLTGTLAVKHAADLLVVDGNPLEDICFLQKQDRILVIMKEGQVVVDRRQPQTNPLDQSRLSVEKK